MHELLYCSHARQGLTGNDIVEILEVSREKNEQLGVTGILLYWEKTREFLQVLEGDKKTIFDLYDTIVKDSRHSLVKLVYDGETQERGFKSWSMAFRNFEEIDKTKIEGFSHFSTQGFTNERTNIKPSTAVQLIKAFRDLLP